MCTREPIRLRGGRLLTLLLLVVAGSCSKPRAKPSKVSPRAQKPETATVVFKPAPNKAITIHADVARSESQHARGLMYRKKMLANYGMLFVFPAEKSHPFWMKNTYIPLDIIFLDRKTHVVGIIENATPLSDEPLSVAAPSLYVIEVNAGFVQHHGVKIGTRVELSL